MGGDNRLTLGETSARIPPISIKNGLRVFKAVDVMLIIILCRILLGRN